MKLVCISDTHSLHHMMKHPLPQGDVLIHAGDVSNKGGEKDVTDFIDWFQSIEGFTEKIFISGNHDFCFERVNKPHHNGDFNWLHHLMSPENLSQSNVTYLEDNFIRIESPEFSKPLKFYGSPWQPWFYDWAFNLPRMGEELKQKWSLIPDDVDVLITHTPPNGIKDYVKSWTGNKYVGCEMLRSRLEEINPSVNIFGHIHEAYGVSYVNNTTFVNASICNQRYEPINKPIVIDLQEVRGEIVATYVEE